MYSPYHHHKTSSVLSDITANCQTWPNAADESSSHYFPETYWINPETYWFRLISPKRTDQLVWVRNRNELFRILNRDALAFRKHHCVTWQDHCAAAGRKVQVCVGHSCTWYTDGYAPIPDGSRPDVWPAALLLSCNHRGNPSGDSHSKTRFRLREQCRG